MNKKGFTLAELMIVIILISGLMYLIIPNITDAKNSMESKTCDAYVELVNSQIQSYFLDNGTYPISLDELKTIGSIKDTKCPDGTELYYSENHVASVTSTTTSVTS